MTDQLLAELLVLREQLTAIAVSPEVRAARLLTADVMPVLEPVWTVLVDQDNGVGFLRSLGTCDESAVNAEVASEVVRAFRSLELVSPGTGAVWQALSRPSIALVTSIRNPPRRQWRTGNQSVRATLGASVRPALPRLLLDEWRDDTEVVPALRRVLRMWCDLARNSTGERREVARLTLAAAMLARGAVLDGDTATVKWFVKRWLGLAATDSRVDPGRWGQRGAVGERLAPPNGGRRIFHRPRFGDRSPSRSPLSVSSAPSGVGNAIAWRTSCTSRRHEPSRPDHR